jgi:predicted dehydrogenase
VAPHRVALVGCGRVGAEFDDDPLRTEIATHAKAWATVGGADFVAAADPDADKLAKTVATYGVKGFSDVAKMLAETNPDVVSIATPPHTHRAITELCIAAKTKVIRCVKPIAGTIADARAMVDACREAGVLLVIDHQRRFEPRHRAAREFVAGGGLGEIQAAVFTYGAGIANTGTHALDLMRAFLGNAEWAEGYASRNLSHKDDDPNIDATIRFENGVLGRLVAVDVDSWASFDLDVLGTAGRLKVLKYGFRFEYDAVGPSDLFSGYNELFVADEMPFQFPERVSPMLAGAEHILECLDAGVQPLSSGEDGLAALELIDALLRSAAADGERVNL